MTSLIHATAAVSTPVPARAEVPPVPEVAIPNLTGEAVSGPSRLAGLWTWVRLHIPMTLDAVLEVLFGVTVGWYCDDCIDVHPEGAICPRAMVADCSECVGVASLTRAGWCVEGRYHVVANRRPDPRIRQAFPPTDAAKEMAMPT